VGDETETILHLGNGIVYAVNDHAVDRGGGHRQASPLSDAWHRQSEPLVPSSWQQETVTNGEIEMRGGPSPAEIVVMCVGIALMLWLVFNIARD
jgi:hypothetical protein